VTELPWFPCFPKDFHSSRKTKGMDAEQVGIYWLLLMDEWENGPLPDDDVELATIARSEPATIRDVLGMCFSLTRDGWKNTKLEKIRCEQHEKHAKRVRAGRLGGQAKAKQSSSNATAMPYHTEPEPEVEEEVKDTPTVSADALDVENSKGGEANGGRTRNVSADANEPSGDVSAGGPKDWNTFAAWMRTEGCALLWKGPDPPDWAHDNKPWTLGRELTVWKQLHKKGEPIEAMVGVIRRTTEPTCGRHFNQAGRFDVYYRAKAEWQRSEEAKSNQVGAILKAMTDAA